MAQTIRQRQANEKFEAQARMGKSEKDLKRRTKEAPKLPISKFWLGILAFVVFGGLLFELVSRMILGW